MKQDIILSRLLDKYEKSKHLLQPGSSTRRVMLRVDKKEFPEYDYEDAQIRDTWNDAVRDLETRGLISTQWVKGRPVLSCVTLNLDHVMDCYQLTGRTHPKELAKSVESLVSSRLSSASTDWIMAWRDDICAQVKQTARVPPYCKKDVSLLSNLVTAFAAYDSLRGEPITMRAFSSKCYQNTKLFEHEIRELFLRIALGYSSGLAEACKQGELGYREQLAYLGIYARPELYELSGRCTIKTAAGEINVAAATPYGLALPSTVVDSITSIDLAGVRTIIFIENKTNYDEFILSELRQDELAVYHGGFLSPQKHKFFDKIAESSSEAINVYFWADIDLGGFQMFERLQHIFSRLIPMRMSESDVVAYHMDGLKRSNSYLAQLKVALDNGKFPLFHAAMKKILEYGVTIEQEVFLME